MPYKKYSERDKARIMAYAISVGFPQKRGSKLYASIVCGIDRKTVKKWYKQVDIELLEFEIMKLKELLDNELNQVFTEMETKRKDSSYRDLTVALGIISDKLILLEGGATSRNENIHVEWKEAIEAARNEDKTKPYKPEMELKDLGNENSSRNIN